MRELRTRVPGSDFMAQYRRAGRNDMPALLLSAWINDEIDDDTCRAELPHAYNAAEWPCRYIDPATWVAVLERLEWVGEHPRPTEPVTLYRAQVGRLPGLSWTPDRKTAEWFHRRNEGFKLDNCRILTETIDPEDILGIFDGREGTEYLVDPYAVFGDETEWEDDEEDGT